MNDAKEERAEELRRQGKTYGVCDCGLLRIFGESARGSLSHGPSCSEHHSRKNPPPTTATEAEEWRTPSTQKKPGP